MAERDPSKSGSESGGSYSGGSAARDVVGVEAFFRPLAESLQRDEAGVGHLLEVRRILEAQAGWLAAIHATSQDIRLLRDDLAEMERALEVGQPVDLADAGFHLHVAEASGNPLLFRIMQGIFAVLDQLIRPGRRHMVRDRAKQRAFVDQHREIFEGIRAGDPERAQEAMYVHLALVEREAGAS